MKISKVLFAVAVIATLGFAACKPKDADLKTTLEEKIATIPELTGVSVNVEDGVATLSGEVKDEEAKAKVSELSKSVKGLKSAVDNTTVAAPPAPVVETPVINATDQALMTGLTDALKDHPTVTSSVKDGKVTLTGEISKSKWVMLKQTIDKMTPAGYDLTGLTIK